MKAWEYTFGPVSKEDWIRQIEKDLRQKPADSLQSEWWPGELLIPLVHREDVGDESVKLPDALFASPPQIGEWILTAGISAHSVNEKISSALQFGAQSIVLQTGDSTGVADNAWFEGVYKDMISVSVQPDVNTASDIDALLQIDIKDVVIRISRHKPQMPFEVIATKLKARNDAQSASFRFIYRFGSSGNWFTEATGVLNGLLYDHSIWVASGMPSGDFFNQCILALEADALYFRQIIQTRVLQLLWQNLMNFYHPDKPFFQGACLESHIEQNENELPERFLIRASTSGLAASVSGTHSLFIHHSAKTDSPAFYERINRNVHHLLSLESGMYKGEDPLSGAYALDFHTIRWTQKIWDALSIEK